jgi:hypothetical protein
MSALSWEYESRSNLDLDYKPKNIVAAKETVDHEHRVLLHTMLMRYWNYERNRQGANRFQAHTDEQFVDGIQWRPEDARVMNERGQPALVFDRLGTPIYWMLGNEKQSRKEFRVLPREEDDTKRAQVKYQVLKYLDDINHTQFHQSKAFEDQVVSGIGWTELGVDDDDEQQQIFHRYQWWREMYGDSRDRSHDLSEARYVIRVKHVDLDMAIAEFPEHEELLRRNAKDINSESDNEWYLGENLSDDDHNSSSDFGDRSAFVAGHTYDNARPETVRFIEVRYRVARKKSGGKSHIRFALMVEEAGGILYDIENPYSHGKFGFVPRYGYRYKDTNLTYGVVRKRRDGQEEYNKRRSKALHILNTRRIRMTKGAVEDIETVRQEAARPDGILEFEQGHTLEIDTDVNLAQAQIELMNVAAREIEEGMGVTDENMGRQGNAISGKAIINRQTQGTTVQATLMDNHRMASQLEGEITMMLIEQFMTESKTVRIIGKDSKPEFVKINQDPDTMLAETKADFVLASVDQTVSARMAMAETFLELAGRVMPTAPEEAKALTAMALQMTDMPFAEQILSYMREMYDFPDPNHEMTDQERAARKQQKEAAAQKIERQEEAAIKTVELKNDEISASIAVKIEQRLKVIAETLDKKVEGFFSAIQAGMQITANPAIAPAADSIIKASVEQVGIDPASLPTEPVSVVDYQNLRQPENPETPGVGQNAGMSPPEIETQEPPLQPLE